MRIRAAVVLCAVLSAGCGQELEMGALPPVDVAPPEEDTVFAREGIPGPWVRTGATPEDFDLEARLCRDRSTDARAVADGDDRAEVAYRTFLDCMESFRWTRGFRPESVPKAPAT